MKVLFSLAILIVALAGCRGTNTQVSASDLKIEIEPATEMVGETVMIVNLSDEGGNPVNDAKVNLLGSMDMTGMQPIIRDIESGTAGIYEVPFEWTMGGEWFVDVTVTLPNDEIAIETFLFDISASDHEMDMPGMNMNAVSTTAVYMTIISEADEDDALINVETTIAGAVELHMTMVDENDVASMMQQDKIAIPTGQMITLEPGGLHVMLIDIQETLTEGESIPMTLNFESGASIEIDTVVQSEAPENMHISAEDLTISNAWVRPIMVDSEMP